LLFTIYERHTIIYAEILRFVAIYTRTLKTREVGINMSYRLSTVKQIGHHKTSPKQYVRDAEPIWERKIARINPRHGRWFS
jgi:hypothetical protein